MDTTMLRKLDALQPALEAAFEAAAGPCETVSTILWDGSAGAAYIVHLTDPWEQVVEGVAFAARALGLAKKLAIAKAASSPVAGKRLVYLRLWGPEMLLAHERDRVKVSARGAAAWLDQDEVDEVARRR